MERELGRRAERPLAETGVDTPERDLALTALAEVRASIDELDAIAGRLARSAVAHGGSWRDVGSALRLKPGEARAAYDR